MAVKPQGPPVALCRQVPEKLLPKIKLPNLMSFWNPYAGSTLFGEIRNEDFERLLQTILTARTEKDLKDKLEYPLTGAAYRKFIGLPFELQLECFRKSYLLPPRQTLARWQLAVDVFHILRLWFTQCQVYVFGSVLTGLNDPTSDVDLYVDLFGDDGVFLETHQRKDFVSRKLQGDLESIMRFAKCPHTGRNFAQLVQPLGSRVRFVRFQHCVSKAKCDISFWNRISVQNSKLIKFYMSYDPRIELLLVFLRYLSKLHGISGELKIKQYALSLLVVVFLTKNKFVPSVHFLQNIAGQERLKQGITQNPDEFSGDDASFCESREIVDRYFTPVPICPDSSDPPGREFLDLVAQFCEMYAFMDFSDVVVCPLVGDTLKKEDFRSMKPENIPDSMKPKLEKFKKFEHDRPLCIQDPFTLSFNVGGVAGGDDVKKFVSVCKSVYNKISNNGGDEVRSILDLFCPLDEDRQ